MSLWGTGWRRTVARVHVIALGAALVAPLGHRLAAQVVRGQVSERTTNTPLDGVLVAVLDARDSVVVQALSAEGRFEIRLPGPGTYALDVKRIGVKRMRLPRFTVGPGESHRLDVTMEPLPAVLSSVRVMGRTSCVRNPQTNARTAALWDDARAALTAAVITRELANGADSVVRFERKLDVTTWRVLYETRRKVSASIDRPFRSLPAEILSIGGYITVNQDGSTDYYAPDADVLLSDTFLTDHCFRIARDDVDHPREIGLAFQPVPERKKPDIKGVLWMDAKTSELRSLEFTYTWLPNGARTVDYGGTVSFFRLPAGRWIVRSWRIRMPEFGHALLPGSGVLRSPNLSVVRISEEGGAVPLTTLLNQGGTVAGYVVTDTVSRQPFAGVTVALEGTADSMRTARDGSFELPFVAPGSYTVALRHPALDSLGIRHLAQPVDVSAGQTTWLTIRFPSIGELVEQICRAPVDTAQRTVLRFIVVDERTGAPLANTPAVFSRFPLDDTGKPAADSGVSFDVMLDEDGGFLACDLRSDEVVRIEAVPDSTLLWGVTVRPRPGAVGWHVIRVGRKR